MPVAFVVTMGAVVGWVAKLTRDRDLEKHKADLARINDQLLANRKASLEAENSERLASFQAQLDHERAARLALAERTGGAFQRIHARRVEAVEEFFSHAAAAYLACSDRVGRVVVETWEGPDPFLPTAPREDDDPFEFERALERARRKLLAASIYLEPELIKSSQNMLDWAQAAGRAVNELEARGPTQSAVEALVERDDLLTSLFEEMRTALERWLSHVPTGSSLQSQNEPERA